jgi:hypothetical protein
LAPQGGAFSIRWLEGNPAGVAGYDSLGRAVFGSADFASMWPASADRLTA